jgi:hypothetical protein
MGDGTTWPGRLKRGDAVGESRLWFDRSILSPEVVPHGRSGAPTRPCPALFIENSGPGPLALSEQRYLVPVGPVAVVQVHTAAAEQP